MGLRHAIIFENEVDFISDYFDVDRQIELMEYHGNPEISDCLQKIVKQSVCKHLIS